MLFYAENVLGFTSFKLKERYSFLMDYQFFRLFALDISNFHKTTVLIKISSHLKEDVFPL